MLLPEVTLRVVLGWELKFGGTKRLPTTSPSGDFGSSTIPLEVRLLRLTTTGFGRSTALGLNEAEAVSLTINNLLSENLTETVSSGDFVAAEERDSSGNILLDGIKSELGAEEALSMGVGVSLCPMEGGRIRLAEEESCTLELLDSLSLSLRKGQFQ